MKDAENRERDSFTFVEELSETHVEQLHALIQRQWWGGRRSLEDVRTMADNTSLMIGMVDQSDHRLVGFGRVLTDFTFRATIYDVMIADEYQGRGYGKRLLDRICNHPRIANVSLIYLACEPDLASFYEQWGFKPYEGRAEWMIKIQREE